jgi:hypothetical protein
MMSTRSHERLEELIVVDALDGLDGPDGDELTATLAEHGPDCDACSALMAGYGDVATALAVTLEPVPVGPHQQERLLAAARLESTRRHLASAPATPADDRSGRVVVDLDEGRRRPRRWIAAIAVAASLALGVLAGFSVAPRPPAGMSAFLSFAADPGTRYATLAPSTASGQTLSVAYRPGQGDAWVFGSSLTKPSGGRTYELWYHRSDAPPGKMSPGGIFVPIHGDVISHVSVGTGFDLLAVTIEPPGGSDQPTTQPIYVSPAITA